MPTAPAFSCDAVDAFATAYPQSPVVVRHALVRHRLLSSDALGAAASRMKPHDVEARVAATSVGGAFGNFHADKALPGWTMLRYIEQLPEYRALLSSILDEVRPVVLQKTGAAHELRGFAFVSAPDTVTPFHFDPEYNLFLQIAGTKQFAVHPAAPPFLPAAAHHALHIDGDNILAWDESFSTAATIFDLGPGDALFVPYKCPHWVKVGAEQSISLSLTWQSAWSYAQRDAHRLNARLARWGYAAPALPAWPKRPALRALAGHALDWVGVA